MSDKAVITCALNGVLTNPKQHHVPVTPEEMAREARAAFNAGASVMHIHLRQQAPNKGPPAVVGGQRFPRDSAGDPRGLPRRDHQSHHGNVRAQLQGRAGLRARNKTGDGGLQRRLAELSQVKADNTWAWPPMMFDHAVEKVQDYLGRDERRRHDSRIRMF